MSERKWTPGPWGVKGPAMGFAEIYEVEDNHIIFAVANPDGKLGDKVRSGEELDANLRLACAAPELFAALEKCLVVLSGAEMSKQGLIDALEAGQAAIRKAVGK